MLFAQAQVIVQSQVRKHVAYQVPDLERIIPRAVTNCAFLKVGERNV